MADKMMATLIGGASPQEVAFKLFERVLTVEGKHTGAGGRPGDTDYADRKYLLDTFAECLHAANGYRDVPKPPR